MDATISTAMLLAVPLLPLISALLIGFFGTAFSRQPMGRRSAGGLAIAGVLCSFLLSAIIFQQVVSNGVRIDRTIYEWMRVGDLKMEVGFLVDSLTAVMMCVVTFVSLMVHIYTVGYMSDDPGYNRFFSYISLFTFSMLMLIMSNNFLQLFFGWEAVGLVSYLLIGFWYDRPTAIFANLKAFLVNRVGDFGFVCGIGLVLAYTGSLHYADVFAKVPEIRDVILPGMSWSLMTAICICLFIGAMAKSAQVPLHVWLPDSMEGPTPISALIHAATMVTAGVFMISRMSPLFEQSETALSFIVLIGAVTALFMGLLGIVQHDIKRVIAYSTLSQLGYMTAALGVSAYSAAVFHLMTHAFFKALLFLAAGSVILGMHHNQDIRYMGNVRRYMPVTWLTFLIGTLALVGTPFFSGFYSKDAIIEAVHASQLPTAGFAYICVLLGVLVTSLYSFRLYFIVFHGKERYDRQPDAHHTGKPHESAAVVTWPLILLAIPSVIIGAMTLMPFIGGDFLREAIFIDAERHRAAATLAQEIHGWLPMATHGFLSAPFWLALIGFSAAWYMYLINPQVPEKLKNIFSASGIYQLLLHKYYLDDFNEKVVAAFSRKLGYGLGRGGDRYIIDGLIVNGIAYSIGRFSGVARKTQTGYLFHYALAMVLGILVLMTLFLWIGH